LNEARTGRVHVFRGRHTWWNVKSQDQPSRRSRGANKSGQVGRVTANGAHGETKALRETTRGMHVTVGSPKG
jgi:hypothetical protein